MSDRQKSRKVNQLQTSAKKALFFAESFGLMPESVVLRSLQTGASVSLDLGSGSRQSLPSTASTPSTPDSSDSDKVMQTLYLLDRFGVSDEFYHEHRYVSIALLL